MKKIPILLMLVILSCNPSEKPKKKTGSIPSLPKKEIVISGLNHPWSMAFLSEEEALVSEKEGQLLRINLSTRERHVIKGFPSDLTDSIKMIWPGDNSGIFEVLADLDFKTNRQIYISYSAKQHGKGRATKVIRAKLENDSLQKISTILEVFPYTREYHHYGGGMTFGADGKLYITTGERLFWEKDEPKDLPIAQNIRDKRGKIYRLNPDGSIPEDNPDFGPDAVPGLYATGIRAAQGITVEPKTGNIWFSEHGTIQGDELNVLRPSANYGWPNVTSGELRSKEYTPPERENVTFTNPVWFWLHTVAPTGLTFYTGDEFPYWKGNLIVSGLSRGSLWRFNIKGETVKSVEELFVDDRVRLRKVVQSPNGYLYLLTDEDNGKVIRVMNQAPR